MVTASDITASIIDVAVIDGRSEASPHLTMDKFHVVGFLAEN